MGHTGNAPFPPQVTTYQLITILNVAMTKLREKCVKWKTLIEASDI